MGSRQRGEVAGRAPDRQLVAGRAGRAPGALSRVLRFGSQLGRDGRFKGPKTAAGKRVLPLPAFAVQVLLDHREKQERERAAATEWDNCGVVISTRTGRPVGHRNAHRSWTRIPKNAGVVHRGIHHMRHIRDDAGRAWCP
jgi:hypothetical protein